MGSPLRAGANATLTFEAQVSPQGQPVADLATDEKGDFLPWRDEPTSTPVVVTAYLRPDSGRDTDVTPRSRANQIGPNTEVLTLKGYCIEPEILPPEIGPYSRAKCELVTEGGRVLKGELYLQPRLQSPWRQVRRVLGSRIKGKLMVTGGGQ